MKGKLVLRKLLHPVAAGLVILTLVLGSISWNPAYAGEEPPTGTAPQGNPDERLERLFAREQEWLGVQAKTLERAGELQTRAEERLDAMREEGKDTSVLEKALESFEELVDEAQTAHDNAAKILEAGKGFDKDGKVIDREQARETVLEAGKALRQARGSLRQATMEVRRALRQYRQAQRGQS
jgi:hypothetical protein